MKHTTLKIKGLSLRYGPVLAVDSFNATVEQGSIVSVLGPSGCGKTSLLSCIAGITKPDEGEIHLGERCLFSSTGSIIVPPERRDIGFVFQNYALWPHMNAFENVAYPLRVRHMAKSEREDRVAEAFAIVDLKGKEKRKPSQLSGGEQQRVALARAIVMRPKLLVMDEPLSNLDAKLRERMRQEILSIRDRLSLTILHVTHDQAEAMAMSDHILVMNCGKLVREGSPAEIWDNPQNSFTATFLGENNLIIREGSNDKQETLYVRPEHVRICPWGPHCGHAHHRRRARIAELRRLGPYSRCVLDEEGRTLLAFIPNSTSFSVGDTVSYEFEKTSAVDDDAQTLTSTPKENKRDMPASH